MATSTPSSQPRRSNPGPTASAAPEAQKPEFPWERKEGRREAVIDAVAFTTDRVAAYFRFLTRPYVRFHNAQTARRASRNEAWRTLTTTPLQELRAMDPADLSQIVNDADLSYRRLRQLANITTHVARVQAREGLINQAVIIDDASLARMFTANAEALLDNPKHKFDIGLGADCELTREQDARLAAARLTVGRNLLQLEQGTLPPVNGDVYLQEIPDPARTGPNQALAEAAGRAAWAAWSQRWVPDPDDPAQRIDQRVRDEAFARYEEQLEVFFRYAPPEMRDFALSERGRQISRSAASPIQNGNRPPGWVGALETVHGGLQVPANDPSVRLRDNNDAIRQLLGDDHDNHRVVDLLIGEPLHTFHTGDDDISAAALTADAIVNRVFARAVTEGRILAPGGLVSVHTGSVETKVRISRDEVNALAEAVGTIPRTRAAEQAEPAVRRLLNHVMSDTAVDAIFTGVANKRQEIAREAARSRVAAMRSVPAPGTPNGTRVAGRRAQTTLQPVSSAGPAAPPARPPEVDQDARRYESACDVIGGRDRSVRNAIPSAIRAQGAGVLERAIGARPNPVDAEAWADYAVAAEVIAGTTNRKAAANLTTEQVGAVVRAQERAGIEPGAELTSALSRRIDNLESLGAAPSGPAGPSFTG